MITINCPSCGAPVKFASSVTVFNVCPFCQSMLVRHDVNVSMIGKQATLPPDQSPFQIGTGGKFGGVHFTLQGRVRMSWDKGFWNEWFAWCDDGRTGWLAEAQGFLSFYFAVETAPSGVRAGETVTIAGKTYTAEDVKQATVVGSEGELPFKAPAGRKSQSIDLNGDDGATATVEYSDDGTRAFVGEYAEFNDFQFSNLKEIDGW